MEKMGYMLQRDNLLEWRTIYKNVLLGLEIKKSSYRGKQSLCNGTSKKIRLI